MSRNFVRGPVANRMDRAKVGGGFSSEPGYSRKSNEGTGLQSRIIADEVKKTDGKEDWTLIEVERTYYPEDKLVYSTDGLYYTKVKEVKSITFKRVNGTRIVFNFSKDT